MHEQGPAAAKPANVGRIPLEALASESLVPVLVEFQEAPVIVWRSQHPLATAAQVQAYADTLRARHQSFLTGLNGQGMACRMSGGRALQACAEGQGEIVLDHDFTFLFNGLGLLVPGTRVSEVAALPGVKAVTGNHERAYLTASESVPFIGAPAVWQRRDPDGNPCNGEGVTIAIIDTGIAGP